MPAARSVAAETPSVLFFPTQMPPAAVWGAGPHSRGRIPLDDEFSFVIGNDYAMALDLARCIVSHDSIALLEGLRLRNPHVTPPIVSSRLPRSGCGPGGIDEPECSALRHQVTRVRLYRGDSFSENTTPASSRGASMHLSIQSDDPINPFSIDLTLDGETPARLASCS